MRRGGSAAEAGAASTSWKRSDSIVLSIRRRRLMDNLVLCLTVDRSRSLETVTEVKALGVRRTETGLTEGIEAGSDPVEVLITEAVTDTGLTVIDPDTGMIENEGDGKFAKIKFTQSIVTVV